MLKRNPTIITGHFGSGKTEFAVNYAANLGRQGENPVLADMDIVNAYFRSRLMKEKLAESGVLVISNNMEEEYYNDTPALSAAVYSCFIDVEQRSILDVGGDPQGATILSRFAHLLKDKEYDMWITVNANRMQTATLKQNLGYIGDIEASSKLKITGLINTTHMLRETGRDDILKETGWYGNFGETGLSVVYTVVPRFLAETMNDEDLVADIFPIDMIMLPDYL